MLLVLAVSTVARADVVDRVVAVVEEQILMDSEVRLEGVLAPLDSSPSPFWAADRATPVDRLIDAAVIRELTGDVSLYQPPEAEVRGRLEAVRAKFPNAQAWTAFLTSWGLDEDGLRAVLRRRISVERWLARNVQASASDRPAWQAALDQTLTPYRNRYRIRVVPVHGP